MTRNSTVSLFALLVPALASATDRHVGSGQQYSTIQAAVDASSTGDVVIVHAGTYAERVVVDSAAITSLTIKANSGDTVTIDAPDQYVNAIIANTVNLWILDIDILSPNHTSPPERAISFVSETGAGVQTFELHLCDVLLDGNNITNGYGIACTPGEGPDELVLHGGPVTIQDFWQDTTTTCVKPKGWPVQTCF